MAARFDKTLFFYFFIFLKNGIRSSTRLSYCQWGLIADNINIYGRAAINSSLVINFVSEAKSSHVLSKQCPRFVLKGGPTQANTTCSAINQYRNCFWMHTLNSLSSVRCDSTRVNVTANTVYVGCTMQQPVHCSGRARAKQSFAWIFLRVIYSQVIFVYNKYFLKISGKLH